jgi:hypothetical protein
MKHARANSPLGRSSPFSGSVTRSTTGDPVLDFIALDLGVFPPSTRNVTDVRPVKSPISKRVGTRAKYAKVGRTNGLPWDTTIEINQSTNLDNGPTKRRQKPIVRFDKQIEDAQSRHDHAAVYKIARTAVRALESAGAGESDAAEHLLQIAVDALKSGMRK